MTIHLETGRLILRPFEDRDIDSFWRYRNNAEVARYQGWSVPYSRQQAEQFVQAMKIASPGTPGEWFQIALERKAGGEMIGDVSFQRLAEDPAQGEFGVTLAPGFQGQGYAEEALKRLLDYLFGELGLHRVRANCDPDNLASGRLLKRLGLRQEGRFIESLWLKGEWQSEDWYALLQREWAAR